MAKVIYDNDLKGCSIILEEQNNLTQAFRLYSISDTEELVLNEKFEASIDAFTGIEGFGAEVKNGLQL